MAIKYLYLFVTLSLIISCSKNKVVSESDQSANNQDYYEPLKDFSKSFNFEKEYDFISLTSDNEYIFGTYYKDKKLFTDVIYDSDVFLTISITSDKDLQSLSSIFHQTFQDGLKRDHMDNGLERGLSVNNLRYLGEGHLCYNAQVYYRGKETFKFTPKIASSSNFSEGVIAVSTIKGWGYMNDEGKEITKINNLGVKRFIGGYGVIINRQKNRLFTIELVDKSGNKYFEGNSTDLMSLGENLFLSSVPSNNRNSREYQIVDIDKNQISKEMFLKVDLFSEGLAACITTSGDYGYIDRTGEMVNNNLQGFGGKFINGLATAYYPGGGMNCFINRDGNITIYKTVFSEVKPFSKDGIAAVRALTPNLKPGWRYIDRSGNFIGGLSYRYPTKFNNGIIYNFVNSKGDASRFQVMSKQLKPIYKPKYDLLQLFDSYELRKKSSFLKVSKNGKWGVLKDGELFIPMEYNNIRFRNKSFSATRYNIQNEKRVYKTDKYSINGDLLQLDLPKLKSPNDNTIITERKVGYSIIKDTKTNLYGVINDKGEKLTKCEFRRIIKHDFFYKVKSLLVSKEINGKNIYGVINPDNGLPIIDVKYSLIHSGDRGSPFTRLRSENKVSIFDAQKFQIIREIEGIDSIFSTDIHKFGKSVFITKKGHLYGLYNSKTNQKIEPKFDQIQFAHQKRYFKVHKGHNVGLYDENFKLVLEPKYDYITRSENGWMVAYKGKAGVMSRDFKQLIPFSYDYIFYDKSNYKCFNKNKQFTLDAKGKILSSPTVSNYKIEKNLKAYKIIKVASFKSEKFAVINSENKIVIPFIYDKIEMFGDNNFLLRKKSQNSLNNLVFSNESNQYYGFHKKQNMFDLNQIPNIEKYTHVRTMPKGNFLILNLRKPGDYADIYSLKTKKIEVENVRINHSHESCYLVTKVNKIKNRYYQSTGVISKTGKLIIPMEYHSININRLKLGEYIINVTDKYGRSGQFNQEGKLIKEFHYTYNQETEYQNLFDKKKQLYGLRHKNGDIVLEPKYNYLIYLYDGISRVRTTKDREDNSKNLINLKGEFIFSKFYNKIKSINKKLFWVKQKAEGNWKIVDLKGNDRSKEYQSVILGNNVFICQAGKNTEIINLKGEIIKTFNSNIKVEMRTYPREKFEFIPDYLTYDWGAQISFEKRNGEHIFSDKLVVSFGDKKGLFSKDFKQIIPPEYSQIKLPYGNNLNTYYIATKDNNNHFLYNANGKQVLNCKGKYEESYGLIYFIEMNENDYPYLIVYNNFKDNIVFKKQQIRSLRLNRSSNRPSQIIDINEKTIKISQR